MLFVADKSGGGEGIKALDRHVSSEVKEASLPGWVKAAAKQLNAGAEGQDWSALARKLGTIYS